MVVVYFSQKREDYATFRPQRQKDTVSARFELQTVQHSDWQEGMSVKTGS